mmetsp:Transcript_25321/g.73090  ORF Transcript_25321/g.73090 Transcript_25321/m.73090 type:complete len:157 (-) Transcript_25321:567-1037(-)
MNVRCVYLYECRGDQQDAIGSALVQTVQAKVSAAQAGLGCRSIYPPGCVFIQPRHVASLADWLAAWLLRIRVFCFIRYEWWAAHGGQTPHSRAHSPTAINQSTSQGGTAADGSIAIILSTQSAVSPTVIKNSYIFSVLLAASLRYSWQRALSCSQK